MTGVQTCALPISFAAFDAVPLATGAQVKLANPMAAYCMELHGTDSAATRIRPAPGMRSAESAAELVEVYWQALTRDVPFTDYGSNNLIAAAVAGSSATADGASNSASIAGSAQSKVT